MSMTTLQTACVLSLSCLPCARVFDAVAPSCRGVTVMPGCVLQIRATVAAHAGLHAAYAKVNTTLADRTCLVADRITLADVALAARSDHGVAFPSLTRGTKLALGFWCVAARVGGCMFGGGLCVLNPPSLWLRFREQAA